MSDEAGGQVTTVPKHRCGKDREEGAGGGVRAGSEMQSQQGARWVAGLPAFQGGRTVTKMNSDERFLSSRKTASSYQSACAVTKGPASPAPVNTSTHTHARRHTRTHPGCVVATAAGRGSERTAATRVAEWSQG